MSEVLAWLDAQEHPLYHRAAASIRRSLAEGQRAA